MNATSDVNQNNQAFENCLSEYRAVSKEIDSTTLDGDEEAMDQLVDRQSKIEDKLFATPARDIADALVKVEIAATYGDACPKNAWTGLRNDLRRLNGANSSPLFDPESWLSKWVHSGGSYFVQDGKVQIAVVAGETNGKLRALSNLLEEAGGSDVLTEFIVKKAA